MGRHRVASVRPRACSIAAAPRTRARKSRRHSDRLKCGDCGSRSRSSGRRRRRTFRCRRMCGATTSRACRTAADPADSRRLDESREGGRATCALPTNPAPVGPMRAALISRLVAWVTKNTPMPESKYPTLADGTLVRNTNAAMGFPCDSRASRCPKAFSIRSSTTISVRSSATPISQAS